MTKDNVGTVLALIRCDKRQCRHSARTVWQKAMSVQFSHGVAKDNVGTVHARCGKRQCRYSSHTVWQKTMSAQCTHAVAKDNVGTVLARCGKKFKCRSARTDNLRRDEKKLAPLSNGRFSVWILQDALVTDRFDLAALAVDSSFLLGDFRVVVFPSVCCVLKCFCFLRAQVFVSVVFPSVSVSCVPKCLCLLCS